MKRRMPIPGNDPTKRGIQRAKNIDADQKDTVIKTEANPQPPDDSDVEIDEFNPNILFRSIPRDNPNDRYKPHSVAGIHKLASGTKGHYGLLPLLPTEEEMVQHYGFDLDRCTQYDRPTPSVKMPKIPLESQTVLNRYPAWLRCFIEMRYTQIHARYGENTPSFLKQLVARLDYQKSKHTQLAGEPKDGQTEEISNYLTTLEEYDDKDEYIFIGDNDKQEESELRRQNAAVAVELDPFRENPEQDSKGNTQQPENIFRGKQIEEVENEITTDPNRHLELWSPMLIQKAGDALRAALVAGASETEDEDYYEEGGDEIIRKKELSKGVVRHKDLEFVYHGKHWEAIVAEESGFKEEAMDIMNEAFMRPDVLKMYRRNKRLEAAELRKNEKKAKKEIRRTFLKGKGHPLLKQTGEVQKKAATWRERGVGKRPSRLFVKSPCDGPIVEVERNLHQTRSLEAMRAYANWIAASATFKYFILIIIFGNACLLAFETGESRNSYNYAYDILDSFFLSIYLAEFLLKFFAYPNQYFLSGFNIFDFVILVVSLVKSITDWLTYGDLEILRFLTIIRALRILRGVSLSVHIQVLVRALLDTLKNHVLNVVVLLILLMYIISIAIFYMWGTVPGLDDMFGSFDKGMLRLFAFVTMDGWTFIMDRFEDVNKLHQGRMFCLVMIVLGNFFFSNIFIAIIIMQISDATDSFRKSRADQRDISVSTKQDEVFRRQKLDMRNLLARQRLGVVDDFYELGSRFVKKLRHDDLIDNQNVIFSPLWMDSLYKGMQRSHHTSNVIMNQHRKMANRLVRLGNLYDEDRMNIRKISRARYNRYYEIKSKLRLIKEEFLLMRSAEPPPKTKVRWRPTWEWERSPYKRFSAMGSMYSVRRASKKAVPTTKSNKSNQ